MTQIILHKTTMSDANIFLFYYLRQDKHIQLTSEVCRRYPRKYLSQILVDEKEYKAKVFNSINGKSQTNRII